MSIYFISDTEFNHTNIIKYCNRPFKTVEEMDEKLIDNWNNIVESDDIVFHLGDFCYGNSIKAQKYFSRLNGHINILANIFHHDSSWMKTGEFFHSISGLVILLSPIHVINVPNIPRKVIVLCHYPIYTWDRKHYLSWHLYGHTHDKSSDKFDYGQLSMNVCADHINFTPVSLEEVTKIMLDKEKKFNLKRIDEK
jgi:calcineurin-like phosphoesterase family protein